MSRVRTLPVVLVALACVLLLGCSGAGTKQVSSAAPPASPTPTPTSPPSPSPSPAPTTYLLTGTVDAPQCGAGYDIENAAVTVRDEHDVVIGATQTTANQAPRPAPPYGALLIYNADGSEITRTRTQAELAQIALLGPGQLQAIDAWHTAILACEVTFTVTVPKAGFYQLRIGTHGAPTYSYDDLQQRGWKLSLTLN